MSYDPATIAVLRRALDEVLLDARFYRDTSVSALESPSIFWPRRPLASATWSD